MFRILLSAGLLISTAGLILGWIALSSRDRQVPRADPNTSVGGGLAEIIQAFPLFPADGSCNRETPAVAVDREGRVFVAWVSPDGASARTLWLARSCDGGTSFEAPVAFRKVAIQRRAKKTNGTERTFTTNVLPRLCAGASALYLGWVESVQGGARVEYLLARSTDGGQTFSKPMTVHGNGAVRPGYTSLALDDKEGIGCAWIDGRNDTQQPFYSYAEAMRFHDEKLVYPGVDNDGICPCCDVAAARSADGMNFIAFRGADGGNRDILVSRCVAGNNSEFESPVPVAPHHWRFRGCPHDGPALALEAERLHVAWMDAHTGRQRVYLASSSLKALQFTARELSPRTAGEQGHPKIAARGNGILHVAWDNLSQDEARPSKHGLENHNHSLASPGDGRAVMFVSISVQGEERAPARLVAPRPGVSQFQPAIAVDRSGVVYLAWNELTEKGKQVVFARLKNSPCGSPPRAEKLPPLKTDEKMSAAVRAYSAEMVKRFRLADLFFHPRPGHC